MTHADRRPLEKTEPVRFDVAEIFREHIGEYKAQYGLSYAQAKAVKAIMACRTAALGGVLKMCQACLGWEFCYKPCKNRHCPKCGAFEKAQWLEGQKKWLLPIPYYHVVFTIDHGFNLLVRMNQKRLFDLFIEVAAGI
jgi:hypothetical protein